MSSCRAASCRSASSARSLRPPQLLLLLRLLMLLLLLPLLVLLPWRPPPADRSSSRARSVAAENWRTWRENDRRRDREQWPSHAAVANSAPPARAAEGKRRILAVVSPVGVVAAVVVGGSRSHASGFGGSGKTKSGGISSTFMSAWSSLTSCAGYDTQQQGDTQSLAYNRSITNGLGWPQPALNSFIFIFIFIFLGA